MHAGARRGRSWRSSRKLADGAGPEAGALPCATENEVSRRVAGALAKASDFEVIRPPAEAGNFDGGAPRLSNEDLGLGRSHSAYLAGCDPPGGALNARSPESAWRLTAGERPVKCKAPLRSV